MQTIRRGSRNYDAVGYLQTLLVKAGYDIQIDERFGPATERAVIQFQLSNGLVADGIVGQKTWRVLVGAAPWVEEAPRFLNEADMTHAADELGVEIAVIKSISEVESRGSGFIGDKPKILFEGHWFWRRLKRYGYETKEIQEIRKENPDILYPSWTKKHYLGGLREYDRLNRATMIHPVAARESASWGMYQIMGFHWYELGYKDVYEFETKMYLDEGEHLTALVRYIKAKNLTKYLKDKNWAGFARRYNGPRYKENNYDVKMDRAYKKYSKLQIAA